jgi:hypothetical protein
MPQNKITTNEEQLKDQDPIALIDYTLTTFEAHTAGEVAPLLEKYSPVNAKEMDKALNNLLHDRITDLTDDERACVGDVYNYKVPLTISGQAMLIAGKDYRELALVIHAESAARQRPPAKEIPPRQPAVPGRRLQVRRRPRLKCMTCPEQFSEPGARSRALGILHQRPRIALRPSDPPPGRTALPRCIPATVGRWTVFSTSMAGCEL